MPTYVYRCKKGHTFEVFHSISDASPRRCPRCRSGAKRVPAGGAGFLFKGSGFYATDYRSPSYKESASKESASKESASKESASKESAGKESAGKEPGSKEASSQETAGKPAPGPVPASTPGEASRGAEIGRAHV